MEHTILWHTICAKFINAKIFAIKNILTVVYFAFLVNTTHIKWALRKNSKKIERLLSPNDSTFQEGMIGFRRRRSRTARAELLLFAVKSVIEDNSFRSLRAFGTSPLPLTLIALYICPCGLMNLLYPKGIFSSVYLVPKWCYERIKKKKREKWNVFIAINFERKSWAKMLFLWKR